MNATIPANSEPNTSRRLDTEKWILEVNGVNKPDLADPVIIDTDISAISTPVVTVSRGPEAADYLILVDQKQH